MLNTKMPDVEGIAPTFAEQLTHFAKGFGKSIIKIAIYFSGLVPNSLLASYRNQNLLVAYYDFIKTLGIVLGGFYSYVTLSL